MNIELSALFAKKNLRLTAQRIALFNSLKSAQSPMSVVDLIKANPAIDKVSIYRTVRLFAELDIVTVVMHGWKQSYELSAPFAPHHHHMVCSSCGRVIEVQSEAIEKLVRDVTIKHNFAATSHHFEVNGLCQNCISQNNS